MVRENERDRTHAFIFSSYLWFLQLVLIKGKVIWGASIKDGKGDNKFVITVAPQKLICPKGKT